MINIVQKYSTHIEKYGINDLYGFESKRSAAQVFKEEVMARLSAPVLGTLLAAEQLVYIPFEIANEMIEAAVRCDLKQAGSTFWMGVAGIVAIVALPIIGLIGLVSPKTSRYYAGEASEFVKRVAPSVPKEYTALQARTLILVKTILDVIPRLATSFNDCLVSLSLLRGRFFLDLIAIPLILTTPVAAAVVGAVMGNQIILNSYGYKIIGMKE